MFFFSQVTNKNKQTERGENSNLGPSSMAEVNKPSVGLMVKVAGLRSYGLELEPLSAIEITPGGLTQPVILPR